jgi:hypothetical protein
VAAASGLRIVLRESTGQDGPASLVALAFWLDSAHLRPAVCLVHELEAEDASLSLGRPLSLC